MPDGVVEHRCPTCQYQIPLLFPGPPPTDACPECGARQVLESARGVDSTALLNFLFCGSCGGILGRYWGMIEFGGGSAY